MTPDEQKARDGLNQRMWDLVRYCRQHLHSEELISDDEYGLLAQDHPAVKRLEDYDAAVARNEAQDLALIRAALEAAYNEAADNRYGDTSDMLTAIWEIDPQKIRETVTTS